MYFFKNEPDNNLDIFSIYVCHRGENVKINIILVYFVLEIVIKLL